MQTEELETMLLWDNSVPFSILSCVVHVNTRGRLTDVSGAVRGRAAPILLRLFFQVKIKEICATTLKKESNKFNEDSSLKWISKFGRNDFERSENIFHAKERL